jgi:hypothetical protein
MNDWLRSAVETLLETGRSTKPDPLKYGQAFDQCLWAIVTSGREDLAELIILLQDRPYVDLPVPLQVVAARLMGLEFPDDLDKLRLARSWAAMYCDPAEDKGAVAGIDRLIRRLEEGKPN